MYLNFHQFRGCLGGVWGMLGCWGVFGGFLGFPCVFPCIYGDFRLFQGDFRVFQGVSGVVGGKLGGIVTYTGLLLTSSH